VKVSTQNNSDFSEARVKEKLTLYDPVIRNLRITMKNSVFYKPEHPIFGHSINNLINALDTYFQSQNKLDIGILQNNLFFEDVSIKGNSDIYTDVAKYLHQRGLISLSFLRGIDIKEISDVFRLLREDGKTIRENGGILKYIPSTPHIKIKEIDYSALLAGTNSVEVTEEDYTISEEERIWQSLARIASETKFGKLPDSKVELLADFFKDGKKSASVLNKVYKDAVTKLHDDTVGKNIQDVIGKICKYFNEHRNPEEAKEIKLNVMSVVARLDPDLINIIFENTLVDGHNFDLSEEITKDFSDSYIAGFLETLISGEDSFNENLLKVFDKLTPDPNQANNVASMIADKLFQKRVINSDTLTKFQTSIREIFKNQPKSGFMSQLYQITVDSVINKKIDSLIYVARLSPLINKFVQSMEQGKLKKEKIWLLLNILWLENSADEFTKFSNKLLEVIPELLHSKDTARFREIMEFFTEKVRTEQKKDKNMAAAIHATIRKITTDESLDTLISFIPESGKEELLNIASILNKAKDRSPGMLVDAFLFNKNPAHRNRFRYIFARMREDISLEALNRLEYCQPHIMKDLFGILREFDPEKQHLIAKRFIRHENPQIRWEALDGYSPKTKKERYDVFVLYKSEKDQEVKKKVASVLLQTKSERIIGHLFNYTQKDFIKRRFLIKLVEVCGRVRSQESFTYLEKIITRKTFFNTKRKDDLRIAVATSLMRLQNPEATALVNVGIQSKSKRLREACQIMMKLAEHKMKRNRKRRSHVPQEVAYEAQR